MLDVYKNNYIKKTQKEQAKRGQIMNKQELIDKLKKLLEMPSEIEG